MYECGNGWNSLIAEAIDEINKYNETHDEKIEIRQIKEKWGLLDILLNFYTPELIEKLDELEKRSATICENCGSPFATRESECGWISTLCKECRKKLKHNESNI